MNDVHKYGAIWLNIGVMHNTRLMSSISKAKPVFESSICNQMAYHFYISKIMQVVAFESNLD